LIFLNFIPILGVLIAGFVAGLRARGGSERGCRIHCRDSRRDNPDFAALDRCSCNRQNIWTSWTKGPYRKINSRDRRFVRHRKRHCVSYRIYAPVPSRNVNTITNQGDCVHPVYMRTFGHTFLDHPHEIQRLLCYSRSISVANARGC